MEVLYFVVEFCYVRCISARMKYKLYQHSIVFFLSLFICASAQNAWAAWSGKVVGVADGDTITVLRVYEQVKIRLYGIDTPEKKQAFGNKAKRYTNAMIKGKSVRIVPVDQDKYGRTVALVYVDDQCLNESLVRDGYAWVYRHYCHKDFCRDWSELEGSARKNSQGLWADRNPTPPWEWRKESKRHKEWWGKVFM
jgi:micrococcal nuclease